MKFELIALLTASSYQQVLAADSLQIHFQNQLKNKAHLKTASRLPAPAVKPIFHLDLSLFGDSDNSEDVYEAMMDHETNLRMKSNDADKFAFIVCGSQHHSKAARSEISKYDSGPLSIAYTSRSANIACWRASLTTGEANTLADSPAFFHVTQVPAPSKFAPDLITNINDQIFLSEDILERGVEIRIDRNLNAGERNSLVKKWQTHEFGLTSREHLTQFFPMSEGTKSWRTPQTILQDAQCHEVISVVLSKETAPTDHLLRLDLKQLANQDRAKAEACVLSTLVYLASQNQVMNIEPIPSYSVYTLVPVSNDDVLPKVGETAENVVIANTVSTTALQSGSESEPNPFWDLGLNGTGQLVEVSDTGFDDASCFFREAGSESVLTGDFNGDVQVARSTYDAPTTDTSLRKIIQYIVRDASNEVYAYDYESGHGTHCAGTVAGYIPNDGSTLGYNGDGFSNCADYIANCATWFCSTCGDNAGMCDTTCEFPTTETYPGTAPGAKLLVYDFGDAAGGISVPSILSTNVFAPAYNEGARVFSNSWGSSAPYNYYSSRGIDLDEYIYEENDPFVLFAAGNDGDGTTDDTVTGDASIGAPAINKNVLTVGAAETAYTPDTVASFSSRGPSKDMRLKPDVVGPGNPVVSAKASGSYGLASCATTSKSGTSMATPAVAGTAALVRQILTEGHHKTFSSDGYAASSYSEATPSAALMKAIMIGSTTPLAYGYDASGNSVTLADFYSASSAVADSVAYSLGTTGVDFTQGFGHVRLSNVFSLDGSFDTFLYEDSIEEYSTWTKYLGVASTVTEVDVTLVWTDPPGSLYCGVDYEDGTTDSSCLVHDLDLKVYNDGTRLYSNFGAGDGDYSGQEDTFNNVEKVTISTSDLVSGGTITVVVESNGLSYNDTQKFAVVISGNLEATDAPTSIPVSSPVTSPISAPVASPVSAPVASPVAMPITAPVPSPTMMPVTGGYCMSGSSTVEVLVDESRAVQHVAISNLKVGDKILSKSVNGAHVYTEVLDLPHSESMNPFIEIEMSSPPETEDSLRRLNLKATLFHTFPNCHGDVVEAHKLKVGDCLLTVDGHRRVAHTQKISAQPDVNGDTFSIVVDQDVAAVAVGGVFTHARYLGMHMHPAISKKLVTTFTHPPGHKLSMSQKIIQVMEEKKNLRSRSSSA